MNTFVHEFAVELSAALRSASKRFLRDCDTVHPQAAVYHPDGHPGSPTIDAIADAIDEILERRGATFHSPDKMRIAALESAIRDLVGDVRASTNPVEVNRARALIGLPPIEGWR